MKTRTSNVVKMKIPSVDDERAFDVVYSRELPKEKAFFYVVRHRDDDLICAGVVEAFSQAVYSGLEADKNTLVNPLRYERDQASLMRGPFTLSVESSSGMDIWDVRAMVTDILLLSRSSENYTEELARNMFSVLKLIKEAIK